MTRVMNLILFSAFLLATSQAYSEKIKIGVSPTISSAGIYLAFENNYFKSENIEAELITVPNSGAAMTLLLAKNELDVGAGNLSSGLFNAISQNQNFKIVADKGHSEKGKEYIALVIRNDLVESGKFKTLKDLKGLKIGMTSLDGVSQQIVIERMLSSAGLKSEDVHYTKLSYAEMNTAMRSKSLDAAIQLEPYLTSGVAEGLFTLFETSQKYAPDQQSAAVFFSPKMISSKKDLGTRFMKAYLRGVRLYNKALKDDVLRKNIVASLKKYIQISDESVWAKMAPVGLRDDGMINVKNLMGDLKWYHDKGFVPDIPSESQMIDSSFVLNAAKQLTTKTNQDHD